MILGENHYHPTKKVSAIKSDLGFLKSIFLFLAIERAFSLASTLFSASKSTTPTASTLYMWILYFRVEIPPEKLV
ncbi:MAG: hypothetical protein KO217_06345 [Methanobacteriaceae archaeon]|jgi:hypothetical protein|nr:hypothetical protein [Methanobacteriaceae archaeon]